MNLNQTTNEMTIHNYKHLDQIQVHAQIDINCKYKKGVEEHGGNLDKKGLQFFAKEMRAEAIDQMVYTHCILQSLDKIREQCVTGMESGYPSSKHDALANILTILNGTEQDLH